MKKFLLAAIFFFYSLISLSLAAENFISKKKIVDQNGLTIIATQMPDNPMVALYALVKTGSATEGEFLGSGISHYLEHMLFKGTPSRKVGEIASQIQALGGEVNASTSLDFTMYTIQVPNNVIDQGLDILSDMLMNSNIDAQEAEKERSVIHGEMRLHNDNPGRELNRLVFQTVYLEHPYKHPIIGYEDLFDKITPQQLLNYYKTHYVPNNMVVSIAGGVDVDQVISKVEERFKNFQRSSYIPRQLPKESPQLTSRRYESFYPTPLTRLSLSYPGVSLLDHDLYAMDVLAMILGQGESSRLYKDLYKEKKLVESISASNYTPVDKGLFEVEADLNDDNREIVINEILNHIALVKDKFVTKEELDKAKRQVKVGYVFSNQTVSQVAWHQAMDEAFTGDYGFSRNYIDGINKVTKEDIQRVASNYLKQESLNIVLLRPKDKEQEKQAKNSLIEKKEIQKIVLDNGLTIVLKQDKSFPIVNMNLALLGGIRYEPKELNGLNYLMTNLWLKGSKKKSAGEIEQLIEENGINLSPIVGRNTIGISLSFLSENTDLSLKLLKEILLEPTFPIAEMDLIKSEMKTGLKYRDENIHRSTRFQVDQILFKDHPFERDNLGTQETINNITQKDIVNYYQKLLDPRNMVLSIYGDINIDQINSLLKNDLSKIKQSNFKKMDFSLKGMSERIEKEFPYNKEQALVMVGFHGPDMFSKDRYKTEVLTSILGSSFSGRLFNSVREELGQAYTMGADYIPSFDTGMIYVYVFTSPDKASQVKDIVEKQIVILQNELVSDKELSDMKTYLKGNFKSDLQTLGAQGQMASLDELYGLGFNYSSRYDQFIDNVTVEDIKTTANLYLNLQKSVLAITKP